MYKAEVANRTNAPIKAQIAELEHGQAQVVREAVLGRDGISACW